MLTIQLLAPVCINGVLDGLKTSGRTIPLMEKAKDAKLEFKRTIV